MQVIHFTHPATDPLTSFAAYDMLGRVTGKGQTVSTVTKSVSYAYTNGDLITMTTPSAQVITFGYTDHRINSPPTSAPSRLRRESKAPRGRAIPS